MSETDYLDLIDEIKNLDCSLECDGLFNEFDAPIPTVDTSCLNRDNSLLCMYSTPKDISFDENFEPKTISFYTLYVRLSPHAYRIDDRDEWFYMEFYEDLFSNSPNIKFIECNGSKCRRSLNFEDTNIWCSSCHGDYEGDMCDFIERLKEFVSIDEIPYESILFARKHEEEFDKENDAHKKIWESYFEKKLKHYEDLTNKIQWKEYHIEVSQRALNEMKKELAHWEKEKPTYIEINRLVCLTNN